MSQSLLSYSNRIEQVSAENGTLTLGTSVHKEKKTLPLSFFTGGNFLLFARCYCRRGKKAHTAAPHDRCFASQPAATGILLHFSRAASHQFVGVFFDSLLLLAPLRRAGRELRTTPGRALLQVPRRSATCTVSPTCLLLPCHATRAAAAAARRRRPRRRRRRAAADAKH